MTQLGSPYIAPWVGVLILLTLPLAIIIAARAAKSSGLGTDEIADALMLGALLAYCWLGFFLTVRLHGAGTLPGQFFPFTIVLAVIAWRLTRRHSTNAN